MRDVSTEIKVGTVVILAIVILLYAIVWIKEYQFGTERFELKASFPEIGTLEIGDPVAVLGVNKGEVKNINLTGNEVILTLSIDGNVELREDATVTISNIGLMGERFVSVNPGNANTPYDKSKPLSGEFDTGISEVFGMMGDIITEVRSLINALEGTFGEEGEAGNIRQIIRDLQELTENANAFFIENKEPMQSAIGDLSKAAGQMSAFLDSNETEISKSASNMAEFSESLTELTNRLNSMTSKIENGEGTLGKTFTDDSLYYDLRSMVNDLDSLITDFKENPKRYVKVSIF